VILVAGGIFLYDRFGKTSIRSTWSIVPINTLAVFEIDRACQDCGQEFFNSNVWSALRSILFSHVEKDSLTVDIRKTVDSSEDFLISLHQIKKDEIDFVFFFHTKDPTDITRIAEKRKLKPSQRRFNSITINEIKGEGVSFSWCLIEDIWVGSFTPFLIEDVIRTSLDESSEFERKFRDVKVLPAIEGDIGNLYIRLDRLNDLVSIFHSKTGTFPPQLGKISALDAKVESGKFILNGFSLDTTTQSQSLLSLFKNQGPTPFESKQFISNRAIAATTFGISNGKQFYNDLVKHQASYKGSDSLRVVLTESKVDQAKLFERIGREIVVQHTQSLKKGRISKTLILETTDLEYWLRALGKISKNASNDSLLSETYSGHVIHEMPLFRLTEKMFYPLVNGFDRAYYTNVGNRVFISEDLQDLKMILNDISMEDTWGKSLRLNPFFETTLLESSISSYFHAGRAMSFIQSSLQSKWKDVINDKKNLFQSLGMGCIQFSHLNNSFYTHVVFECANASAIKPEHNNARDRLVVNFESPVSSIHVVKSHVSRDNEVLIQDSLNNLSLVAAEGNVLWKKSTGGTIVGDVTQVDFFNNGKLQYFFATNSALHIIDRLGNYVSGFPLELGQQNLMFGSVIDYDDSKNYRFLAADSTGALWMFDKNGNNLEGWRPRYLPAATVAAPRHFRIKGKDYIVAILKGGLIAVMNRRGEMLKKFPVKFPASIQGEFAFEGGTDLKNSLITIVTEDAFKLQVNLLGDLVSKEPLLKSSLNTTFRLVADKSTRSYLILQQDDKNCKLLNDEGKEIFSNESIGNNHLDVKFDFSSQQDNYITVIDQEQELAFVYDFSGRLVTDPPIESNMMVIKSNDGHYKIFHALGKTLVIQSAD
jgi:hypothetical protein